MDMSPARLITDTVDEYVALICKLTLGIAGGIGPARLGLARHFIFTLSPSPSAFSAMPSSTK